MYESLGKSLGWTLQRFWQAPMVMKVVYGVVSIVIIVGASCLVVKSSALGERFALADPNVQLALAVFVVAGMFATLLFAVLRSQQRDQVASETKESQARLQESHRVEVQLRKEIEDHEHRWDKLLDVECREALWSRPVSMPPPRFVPINERTTRFVSVLNLKGGVGKTTLTANIAASLAGSGSKPLRVLIVDIDFQGTISDLCLEDAQMRLQVEGGRIANQLLDPEADQRILKGLAAPIKNFENARVVVATDQLEHDDYRHQARFFLDANCDPRFAFRRKLHTVEVFQAYDLVIFDCPPRLTTSAVNAIACSDHILIPTKLDDGSILSVARTLKWLESLNIISYAKVLGVVAVQTTSRVGKLIKDQQNQYAFLKQEVAKYFHGNDGVVFTATLPSHSAIASATRGTVPVANPDIRELFLPLVQEFRRRINQ